MVNQEADLGEFECGVMKIEVFGIIHHSYCGQERVPVGRYWRVVGSKACSGVVREVRKKVVVVRMSGVSEGVAGGAGREEELLVLLRGGGGVGWGLGRGGVVWGWESVLRVGMLGRG